MNMAIRIENIKLKRLSDTLVDVRRVNQIKSSNCLNNLKVERKAGHAIKSKRGIHRNSLLVMVNC